MIEHSDYSGWFPFYIADTARFALDFGTSSLDKAAPVTGLSLDSLTKAFWRGKSFDVTVDMSSAATVTLDPHASSGGAFAPGSGSERIIGTTTIDLSSFLPGSRTFLPGRSFSTVSYPRGLNSGGIIPGITGTYSYTFSRTGMTSAGTEDVLMQFDWFTPIKFAGGWYRAFEYMVKSGGTYLTNAYFRIDSLFFGSGAEAAQFVEYVIDPSDFVNYPVIGRLDLNIDGETISLPIRGPLPFGPDYDDGEGNSKTSSASCNVTVDFNNFF